MRQLIGSAHWPSDGYHKEAIVREFLVRHLPGNLLVSHGFVRTPDMQLKCSPEIDVLIADPSAHPPLFAEGGLHIVAPSSTVAYVSVKTRFTKQNLVSALHNIKETQQTIRHYADPNRVWRGILFYDIPEDKGVTQTGDVLKEAIAETYKKEGDPAGNSSETIPTCITVMSSFVAFISATTTSTITVRVFGLEHLSFACAFADCFSSVRRWYGHKVAGELDDMIDCLACGEPYVATVNL